MPDIRVTREINKRIQALLDTSDFDYKILIAGASSSYTLPSSGNVLPSDLNAGGMANMLEYNLLLSDFLIEQMNLNTTVGDFLDYLGNYYYGIYREVSEDDATYAARIRDEIFGLKETPQMILSKIRQYSSAGSGVPIFSSGGVWSSGGTYPFLVEGIGLNEFSAYADYCYADYYQKIFPPPEDITPAFSDAEGYAGVPYYYFKVFMLQCSSANAQKVFDITNKMKVSGVGFSIYFLDSNIFTP